MASAGGLSQGRFRVPYERSFQAEVDQHLYLSAQNPPDGDVLTCEIVVDGAVVASSTSYGPHTIATCSERTR